MRILLSIVVLASLLLSTHLLADSDLKCESEISQLLSSYNLGTFYRPVGDKVSHKISLKRVYGKLKKLEKAQAKTTAKIGVLKRERLKCVDKPLSQRDCSRRCSAIWYDGDEEFYEEFNECEDECYVSEDDANRCSVLPVMIKIAKQELKKATEKLEEFSSDSVVNMIVAHSKDLFKSNKILHMYKFTNFNTDGYVYTDGRGNPVMAFVQRVGPGARGNTVWFTKGQQCTKPKIDPYRRERSTVRKSGTISR